MQKFDNRSQAGKLLGQRLLETLGDLHPGIVLGLPRGGVPVAAEVASTLGLPLDVFVVRKLGVPGHEEYAMGAIASGGIRVLNREAIRQLHIPDAAIDAVARVEAQELERRERAYRGDRAPLELNDRNVILVDDGLATGASMRAAVSAIRTAEPRAIIVAVPVAPKASLAELNPITDRYIVLSTPEPFYAVGAWYRDFTQVSDREVQDLMAEQA